jgi:hypothetical protein
VPGRKTAPGFFIRRLQPPRRPGPASPPFDGIARRSSIAIEHGCSPSFSQPKKDFHHTTISEVGDEILYGLVRAKRLAFPSIFLFSRWYTG